MVPFGASVLLQTILVAGEMRVFVDNLADNGGHSRYPWIRTEQQRLS